MDIAQIVAIGLVSTILALTVKKQSPEMAIIISIAASILIFVVIFPRLTAVISVLQSISERIDTRSNYIDVVLRIIGISYIAEFGSEICKDAGQTSLASKIDLGGKIIIMTIAAPIILSLIDVILSIMP